MQRRDHRHQDLHTIGSMNNHPHRNLTRRQFLNVVLGGSTALALPALVGCTNTTAIQPRT